MLQWWADYLEACKEEAQAPFSFSIQHSEQ